MWLLKEGDQLEGGLRRCQELEPVSALRRKSQWEGEAGKKRNITDGTGSSQS